MWLPVVLCVVATVLNNRKKSNNSEYNVFVKDSDNISIMILVLCARREKEIVQLKDTAFQWTQVITNKSKLTHKRK